MRFQSRLTTTSDQQIYDRFKLRLFSGILTGLQFCHRLLQPCNQCGHLRRVDHDSVILAGLALIHPDLPVMGADNQRLHALFHTPLV